MINALKKLGNIQKEDQKVIGEYKRHKLSIINYQL